MPVRILRPKPPVAAVPRRRMRAADIPEVIRLDDKRKLLPYSMFAKEWEWWPEDRSMMVVDRPVSDDNDNLCRIAAVVHALCDRDGVAVPEWVWDYRAPKAIALSDSLVVDGQLLRVSVAEAPSTCEYHNVWFSYRTIEPLSSAAERIKRVRRKHSRR